MLAIATTPIAYEGEEMFGFKDVTEDFEFAGMEWVGAHRPEDSIGADQRISDVLVPYYNISADKLAPLKIKHEKDINYDLLYLQSRWATEGAQFYPMESIIIEEGKIIGLLSENNVLYTAGPTEERVFIVEVI